MNAVLLLSRFSLAYAYIMMHDVINFDDAGFP